jgi:hypothetical protein
LETTCVLEDSFLDSNVVPEPFQREDEIRIEDLRLLDGDLVNREE